MPDAFISMTTSWASGAGSGNCINSSPRSPVNTIPRIAASVCLCLWFDLERKNVIGKGRTDRELQAVAPAPRKIGAGGYGSRLARSLSSGRPKAGPVGLAGTTRSNRTRGDVDHQGEQCGIEYKRDDAVRGGGTADGLVGDADVGDLRGHSDHEREIHKVPVVGVVVLIAARKLQAARLYAAGIIVGRMQPEGGGH